MSSYRAVLHLTPTVRWQHGILDSHSLLESLAGVEAHQVATDQWGNVTLDVTLDRDDHQGVLNDLFALAQQFGYDLLNGEISKLVDSAVEGAILTGLGGGALVRVPAETGHPIRTKPATQSGRIRPPVPVDSGHLVEMILDG